MILLIILGGGLGWIVHRARAQRDIVAAIVQAGGSVDYDWEWTDGDYIPGKRASWPKWLGDRIGIDYVCNVSRVILLDIKTDPVLVQVGKLNRLECLYLSGPAVTDGRLEPLERLTRLEELRLLGGEIRDAGLAHLESMRSLRRLFLGGPKITNAGLVHLKGLTNLEVLYVMKTGVTGEGMEKLRLALPKLLISL
jgi:hypothetical protein